MMWEAFANLAMSLIQEFAKDADGMTLPQLRQRIQDINYRLAAEQRFLRQYDLEQEQKARDEELKKRLEAKKADPPDDDGKPNGG